MIVLQNFQMECIFSRDILSTTSTPGFSESNETPPSQVDINNDRSFRIAMTSIILQEHYHLTEHENMAKAMCDEIQDYF